MVQYPEYLQYPDTEPFGIGRGVRQGCILSPILFNLYAEKVMRDAGLEESEEGVKVGGRNLNNLRYADDVTLLARNDEDMRKLIQKVKAASGKAGLFLNIAKTKIISTTPKDSFDVDGVTIEVVNKFVLLGSVVESEGDCRMEMRRLALGRAAMGGLDRIWKDRGVSVSTKARLVRALVFPVATYSSETSKRLL